MHSQLEAYLDQVAAHLSALPVKRRNEELREMRQHLLNAVTVNQELGQSEEDAAANAVVQFGTAEDLSDNLVWAWRRERKLAGRDLWAAAVSAPLMMFIMIRLNICPHLMHARPHSFMNPPFSMWRWAEWIIWLMPEFLLVGSISGFLFPKRALTGVTTGMIIYHACYLAPMVLGVFQMVDYGPESVKFFSYRCLAVVIMDSVVISITVGAAWAGRQARQEWRKRRRTIRA